MMGEFHTQLSKQQTHTQQQKNNININNNFDPITSHINKNNNNNKNNISPLNSNHTQPNNNNLSNKSNLLDIIETIDNNNNNNNNIVNLKNNNLNNNNILLENNINLNNNLLKIPLEFKPSEIEKNTESLLKGFSFNNNNNNSNNYNKQIPIDSAEQQQKDKKQQQKFNNNNNNNLSTSPIPTTTTIVSNQNNNNLNTTSSNNSNNTTIANNTKSEKYLVPMSLSTTRVCEFCGSSTTPTWRRGPSGKGSLCNACGIKWRLKGKDGIFKPSQKQQNRQKPSISQSKQAKQQAQQQPPQSQSQQLQPNSQQQQQQNNSNNQQQNNNNNNLVLNQQTINHHLQMLNKQHQQQASQSMFQQQHQQSHNELQHPSISNQHQHHQQQQQSIQPHHQHNNQQQHGMHEQLPPISSYTSMNNNNNNYTSYQQHQQMQQQAPQQIPQQIQHYGGDDNSSVPNQSPDSYKPSKKRKPEFIHTDISGNPVEFEKGYYCKYCKKTWPQSSFRNSQQFGAHCSNCSRKPKGELEELMSFKKKLSKKKSKDGNYYEEDGAVPQFWDMNRFNNNNSNSMPSFNNNNSNLMNNNFNNKSSFNSKSTDNGAPLLQRLIHVVENQLLEPNELNSIREDIDIMKNDLLIRKKRRIDQLNEVKTKSNQDVQNLKSNIDRGVKSRESESRSFITNLKNEIDRKLNQYECIYIPDSSHTVPAFSSSNFLNIDNINNNSNSNNNSNNNNQSHNFNQLNNNNNKKSLIPLSPELIHSPLKKPIGGGLYRDEQGKHFSIDDNTISLSPVGSGASSTKSFDNDINSVANNSLMS